MAFDITKFAGKGMDIELTALPIISVLQKGSAEVDETHENYSTKGIEGAKAGNLCYAPDSTLYNEMEVLFLKNVMLYAEWRPRNQGGGLVAHHPLSIIRSPSYKPRDPNNPKSKEMLGENDLIQTSYWLVQFKHKSGEWTEGLFAMSSTNLTCSRAIGKLIRGFDYPETSRFKGAKPFSFSRSYIISTEARRNEEGSWYALTVKPGLILDKKEDEKLLEETAAHAEKADRLLPTATEAKALPPSTGVVVTEEGSPF